LEVQEELGWWQHALAKASGELPVEKTGLQGLAEQTLRLDRARTQRLLEAAPRAYRLEVDELLLTALAQTVGQWSGQAEVLVELEGHGRSEVEELDASRTVGWLATRYPVVLPVEAGLTEALVAVKNRLRSVPHKGLHWGVLEYLSAEPVRQAMRALARPQMRFNYLGQFDQCLSDEGRFGFAVEAAGRAVLAGASGYMLDVSSLVVDGGLTSTWHYRADRLGAATVRDLIADFHRRLNQLIDHCLAAEATVSPADFDLDLQQSDFDALLEQIEAPDAEVLR
jgi:non-ribosomal peptide synthase protein (TIGR01720 family)